MRFVQRVGWREVEEAALKAWERYYRLGGARYLEPDEAWMREILDRFNLTVYRNPQIPDVTLVVDWSAIHYGSGRPYFYIVRTAELDSFLKRYKELREEEKMLAKWRTVG